jgi:sporulation protein YlmC with PRC-barrel domain
MTERTSSSAGGGSDRGTAARTTCVHDFIASRVVDANGRSVGRVLDLELERDKGFAVVGLELAPPGPLGRLGISRLSRWLRGDEHGPSVVPWSSVESFHDGTVRLVPGAPPPTEGGPRPSGPTTGRSRRRTGRKRQRPTIRENHRE